MQLIRLLDFCTRPHYNSVIDVFIKEGEAMSIKEITEDMFEAEVLKAEKPVLVDFYAPWCGDCRRIVPALDAKRLPTNSIL